MTKQRIVIDLKQKKDWLKKPYGELFCWCFEPGPKQLSLGDMVL